MFHRRDDTTLLAPFVLDSPDHVESAVSRMQSEHHRYINSRVCNSPKKSMGALGLHPKVSVSTMQQPEDAPRLQAR
jgi:hypothetical protein